MSEPLLRELAAQLGTTLEYVYAVLVRQQQLQAMAMLLGGIVSLVLVAGGLWGIACWARRTGTDVATACLGAGGGWAVAVLACVGFGADAALHWLNPEYYAIQVLLATLRRGP